MKMKNISAAIAALEVLAAVIWAAVVFTQLDKPYFPPKPEDTALEFWMCDDGGSYVTRIEITDPAVSVYGLTIESEPAEVR